LQPARIHIEDAGPKYLMVVLDGAADRPLPELEGRTPLQAADTPAMSRLAAGGIVGLVKTVPDGMTPGTDVAFLSILGYDPKRYFAGRAGLEALSLGIPLDAKDVAFRCNLVTVDDDAANILHYSAGEISTQEARPLVTLVRERLGSRRFVLHPGQSFRNILVWRAGSLEVQTTPPHEVQGQAVEPHLPRGDGDGELRQFIFDSFELLHKHDINRRRLDEGRFPANMLWPWGQGRLPQLPSFPVMHGVTAALVAGTDTVKGMAAASGITVLDVPGATGNLDTDFAAKGRAAISALEVYDLVIVHIEAPDTAAHNGDLEGKVWSIEQIDHEIVGPVADFLRPYEQHKVLILPDHYTCLSTRGHAADPVPFLLYTPFLIPDHSEHFDEPSASESDWTLDDGHRLINLMLVN